MRASHAERSIKPCCGGPNSTVTVPCRRPWDRGNRPCPQALLHVTPCSYGTAPRRRPPSYRTDKKTCASSYDVCNNRVLLSHRGQEASRYRGRCFGLAPFLLQERIVVDGRRHRRRVEFGLARAPPTGASKRCETLRHGVAGQTSGTLFSVRPCSEDSPRDGARTVSSPPRLPPPAPRSLPDSHGQRATPTFTSREPLVAPGYPWKLGFEPHHHHKALPDPFPFLPLPSPSQSPALTHPTRDQPPFEKEKPLLVRADRSNSKSHVLSPPGGCNAHGYRTAGHLWRASPSRACAPPVKPVKNACHQLL